MAASKVLCIEVSDIVTRVVEMDNGKKDPVIHKAVVFNTPDGTVNDGIIEVADVFSKELGNQLKSNGIHTKEVIFTLVSNKVISREVPVPDLKDDQIPEFIQNQKAEYFPMDTSGHVMVHRVLERNKETKQMRMVIFALPQRIVANYQMVASMVGLKVIGVDYCGNSLFQWLQNDNHKEMAMYLQINERSSMFTIMEGRKLAIQRNINFGAYALADRLLQSGYYENDEESSSLTRSDAIRKLSEEEFVFPSFAAGKLETPDTEAAERLHSAKEMITEGLRPLLGNLSRVMEYYHVKNKDAEISTIYIGGIGAKIKGLKSFLENEFAGVETVVLEQLPDVKVSHAVEKSGINTSELIACLGAVDKSITFITISEKEKTAKFVKITIVAVAVVAAAAVALILWGRSQYNKEVDKKKNLDAKLASLEAENIEDLENRYYAATSRISEAISADDSTKKRSEALNLILAEMEAKSVSSTSISSISFSNDSMNMGMSVDSKEAVAKEIMQFAQIPYFSNVAVNGFSETAATDQKASVVTFTMAVNLKDYFNQDINGDGVVDESDDVNGDGTINELDKYRDFNNDGVEDRLDIEAGKAAEKGSRFELIENDINGDGVVDELDDMNGDTIIDDIDRQMWQYQEAGIAIDIVPEGELPEGAVDANGNVIGEEVTE